MKSGCSLETPICGRWTMMAMEGWWQRDVVVRGWMKGYSGRLMVVVIWSTSLDMTHRRELLPWWLDVTHQWIKEGRFLGLIWHTREEIWGWTSIFQEQLKESVFGVLIVWSKLKWKQGNPSPNIATSQPLGGLKTEIKYSQKSLQIIANCRNNPCF